MGRHSGRNGDFWMSTTGTGAASRVASIDKWDIDMGADYMDDTCFLDGNKQDIQGWPAINGTFHGWWDDTETKPNTGRTSTDGVVIKCYPNITTQPGKYACGPAWIDMKVSADAKGGVEISGNFRARGTWNVTL